MADQSEELKKLELISAARKIVNAEYIKRRSDEYNKWLLANKDAFKNTNPALPFSPPSTAFIPFQSNVVFPTEDDVVKKAVELYKLTNITTAVPVSAEPSVVEPVVEHVVEPVVLETLQDAVPHIVPNTPEELTDIQLRDALVAEIYKIYEDVGKPEHEPKTDAVTEQYNNIDPIQDLNPIPQPAEVLGATESSGPLSSVFQRIQELKNSWIKKTGDTI